jgi:uncharacterized protein YuzB (UPF0349 family)
MKSGRNGKKRFYVSFVKQRFCNGITTLSKRYRNGPLATKRFRNGTETVHLQQNNSLQWIEMDCETFREKCFENYFATVLQQYLQGTFDGKRLCNDNLRFTEKRILFCQETIIVSIRLQQFNLKKLP